MIKAIFFDLDGTLLPLKDSDFYSLHLRLMISKLISYGYSAENLIEETKTMMKLQYQNDGSKTNEEVYNNYFYSIYGEKFINDKPVMELFYKN